jgi:hypothetical protein
MRRELQSILAVSLLLAGHTFVPVLAEPGSRFRRGDSNDDGRFDLADSIRILNWLFAGGVEVPCVKSADVNDDGRTDMSDPISLLAFLFLGNVAPPQPYPDCGQDPTPDGLSCESARGSCPEGLPTDVGAAGGTVLGPSGASVVIPPGALATETTIRIEQITSGAPELPAGLSAFGPMFALTPHGTTFGVPVTLTLPFDAPAVPAGAEPALYKTNAQSQWEQVVAATFDVGSVSARITSFSDATVVIPPLFQGEVGREWSMYEYRGDGLSPVKVEGAVELGGDLSIMHDFGSAALDSELVVLDGTTIPADRVANGVIWSAADGKTFYVGAEAPDGIPALGDPIGGQAELIQVQSFIKRSDDASLTFTLPRAFIEVNDRNAVLGRICPPAHAVGLLCPLVQGELYFEVQAINTDFPTPRGFYHLAGGAAVEGFAENWNSQAWTYPFSRAPLWTTDDFDFVIENDFGAESHVVMSLRNPRTLEVDLSSIAVGKAFHVRFHAWAYAHNRIAGPPSEFETAAGAYLNLGPLHPAGVILEFAGLEVIDTPSPLPTAADDPVPPAGCVPGPGPNPAAGVIEFSAPTYSIAESSATPTVIVTRTGGNAGAVSASFTTHDGSAVAGTDYTPVNGTVFFADGDATPRVVDVPIIQDLIDEPDRTVNLTLSQPGGCAALGTRSIAVLTIRDDDVTPPTRFTVGGTVTGLVGKGLVLEDHHGLLLAITGNGPFTFSDLPTPGGLPYSVRVFNQPHDPVQVCTVTNGTGTFTDANVTNVLVTCAAP